MVEKEKINFLLYGEGSFLNKGCEAIVNTTVKKIKEACEGNIVLSTNDMNDKNSYNDIITKYVKGYYKEDELSEEEKKKIEYYKTIPFDYTNFEKIYEKDCLKEIKSADICLSVGGDNYCYGEPNWIYTINKTIKEENKKNVFWCTSLFEKIESPEMMRDLKTYDLIMVRETLTYKALAKFIDEERLMLVPDTAFSLSKKEVKLPEVFSQNKKVVGINISPLISNYTQDKKNILESLKALIDYILKKTDYNICLIPHVYLKGNNDLETLEVIKELYKKENRVGIANSKIYDCEELKYIISHCNYLIAARTHASIAGYSSIVPTLVIGYSVKSKGIALDLFGEYENYVIPVDKMTPELLLEKFNYITENEEKIVKILKEKMPVYEEKANNLVNMMLERLEELDKKYVTSYTKCTGCMACVNICPHNAIEVVKNEEGFLYTKINDEKCTRCNLCKRICPANKVYKNKYEKPEFYAVINKNEKERKNSSSGGVVATIANEILKEKGTVYGVELQGNNAKHIRIENKEDLHKIMGSKYLQSEIGKIYKDVKKDLENNRKVLFTGTPCQIEGLKSFLNKEYEKLICISIICHGVPSPEIFKKYLEEKEKNEGRKIENVEFRNKKNGWHKFSMNYRYKEGKEESKVFTNDEYMQGFLKNYYLRESCYNCQMRFEKKNSADIIIGDFWGIELVFPDMDDDKGISAVIINSEKGFEIFKKIQNNITYKKTTFEDILRANPVLTSSVKYTKKKQQFFDLIKNNEIIPSINTLYVEEIKKEMENKNKELDDKNAEIKYLKGQVELREIRMQEKDNDMQNIIKEKEEIWNQLQNIYNSKRWKYIDKIGNTVNKIKGKKG